ncbi:MAG: hypothetical protein V4662_04035 [Verrucomicrobiota bacterium]
MPHLIPPAPPLKNIRRKGLVKVALGLAIFGAGLAIAHIVLPYFGQQLTPPGLIPLGLPGAYALAGLIEVITGMPFLEVALRWDQLKGWQRGALGTLIVLIAATVILWIFTLAVAD